MPMEERTPGLRGALVAVSDEEIDVNLKTPEKVEKLQKDYKKTRKWCRYLKHEISEMILEEVGCGAIILVDEDEVQTNKGKQDGGE